MSAAEIIEQLGTLSDDEFRRVIEVARRQRQQSKEPQQFDEENDAILSVAGSLSGDPVTSRQIDEILYGVGPA